MSIEATLVKHATAVRYDDLPVQARDAAKREVLWALGTAVAGAGIAGSQDVMDVVRALGRGCSGDATVIGYGERAPALLAGFANGVFAKAAEYEDKLWLDNTHGYSIGAAVVTAAFAAAEHVGGASGKALLSAVAVATDVQARMVMGAPHARHTPFNSTYMFSHFGAAVAAGRLLGLTEEQMFNALGIAYTQVAGNYQAHHERTLAVRMQLGFCVRNGLFAALMGKAGIDGPHEFLVGKSGLYPTFFKECDEEPVLKDLGTQSLGTRLGFKGYPCGAVAHPVLDAVFQVKKAHGVTAGQIAGVEVHGSPSLAIMSEPLHEKQRPRNHVDLEFSLPWVVACALSEERLSLKHFQDSALKDNAKLALAQKVTVRMDPAQTQTYAVVVLTDGRKLTSSRIGPATGHPDNPLPTDEMVERYRDCVAYGPKPLHRDNTERAKDLVLNLENVSDATEIVRLLG